VTSATSAEVDLRKKGRPRRPRDLATAFGSACIAAALALGAGVTAHSWPSDRYRERPVEFFREVIGVEPWEKQVEIIEAVRDNPRVAVASGHKVSKSHTAGGIALWFYESYEDARVVMSSTTSRQVDQILWREVKMMHARSGRCVACKEEDKRRLERREPPGPRPCPHSELLDGNLGQLARTGLKSPDFREIVGFTAREAEAVAGVSGKNLLYILDEASGIPDVIFEAIEGNRAGGARVVMFSNPTRTEGEFFAAFDSKKDFYKTIQISSEETPNVRAGREIIPGLATAEWVEEKRREWGEDSPLYKIRVKGQFVLNEDGKIISVHAISEAEKRWFEPAEQPPPRLHIGLDPAGATNTGDESVFALRRGFRLLGLIPFRALSEEAHLAHLLGIIKQHSGPRELPPIVKIDREGSIGAKVYGLLRLHADASNEVRPPYELVGVRASERAIREPTIYDRVRDELWANLAQWFREGGAIVEDVKLEKELHAPEWIGQVNGRQKVTAKEDLRKMLGRSPDRADATCLAVWDVPGLVHPREPGARPERDDPPPQATSPYDLPSIDPYRLDGDGG
jgi:phage terminase large subunit